MYRIKLFDELNAIDEVQFWRTSAGNEVDFVMAGIETPKAIKANKYKIFTEAYPEIPLSFLWAVPFNDSFFKRLKV